MKKLLLTLLLGILFLSCGKQGGEKPSNEKGNAPSVTEKTGETLAVSIPPLKWLVEKIAGDGFNVISIVQPNANHELFEPNPEDLKKLENSKLFFTYNLLGFEKKISESLNNNSNKVVNVLNKVKESELLEGHDHDEDGHSHSGESKGHAEETDPHVWFSLGLMPKAAAEIKDSLIAAYPEKKDMFEKNYENFLEELSKFRAEIERKMASKTKKSYIIYHPALNYFRKDYKVEEVAVEYEGKEPTARQIKDIIEEAKEHNISLILVQPQFPKQSIEIISKEIPGSKIIEFNADKENVFENLNYFVDNLE